MVMRWLFAVVLLLLFVSNGFALVFVERDGLLFYYPEEESKIARRLFKEYPRMIQFLKQQGLPVEHPLHVILDDHLDLPQPEVHMIPHREIRIPLRAPGVVEDGYTEADPWLYFLFQGLCLQGLYSVRSGIPGRLHKMFGEIVSPNIIIPDWLTDGTSHLLYILYQGKEPKDPFHTAVFEASVVPDLAKTSNHPGIWPGYFSYRIYGRPFIRWVYDNYGWDRLLAFIRVHGEGIIPIEIDLKAKESFGISWSGLWNSFRKSLSARESNGQGLLITGYWTDPSIYWNAAGVYPGVEKVRIRGRYGYVDKKNILWLSEYDEDGVARVVRHAKGLVSPLDLDHVWDPGPGGLAVTRNGSRPAVIRISPKEGILPYQARVKKSLLQVIPAPPGVLQMSGPVEDRHGRIAVAADRQGDWDIWVYDGCWTCVTPIPSIEMDPWWEGDRLVFASNVSGRFQIHGVDMRPLTDCPHAAALPRGGRYLRLKPKGWEIVELEVNQILGERLPGTPPIQNQGGSDDVCLESKLFAPLRSLRPNYWIPDIFIGDEDLQIGAATRSRDVTRDYTTDAGVRYSLNSDFFSWRLGGTAKDLGLRLTRYPLDYTTALAEEIEEARNEVKASWMPFGTDGWLELSANYRTFEPLEDSGSREDEFWGALRASEEFGDFRLWGNLELYTGGTQSLFGGFRALFGKRIYSSIHVEAGKSWGDIRAGHHSYRIGGNVVEGYFTQRPTRLFPLRGFESNVLDASQAITAGIEFFWPLVNLQRGYKTLPLFLHKLRLGTFVDAGAARESLSWDDCLVSVGIELITSMEIAWGNLSGFRMGIAWPVRQPEYLDEEGPIFLIQLGRPL
jgi:hypothetical protein